MNAPTRSILVMAVIAGLAFAIFTAAVDYFDDKDFKILKFIVNVISFSLLIGFLTRYNFKRQEKRDKNH